MILRLVLAMAAIGTLSFLTNCVHPMGAGDIEQLTTCPNSVDLGRVKKNLLLAGYGIEHATNEELVTDFRQSAGRSWQRVTALVLDNKVKFRVRVRKESMESLPTTSSTTTYSAKNKPEKDKKTTTYENRAERVTNDMDMAYYIEHRVDYEQTKMDVCGTI